MLASLQDTTAQIRVRGAFVLLIGFVALAEQVGLETILGAFAAGALLSLVDRDEAMTHPLLRLKLEAAGFGLFIPVFFITERAAVRPERACSRAPRPSPASRCSCSRCSLSAAFPALLYSSQLGRRQAAIAGLLQSTSLPFIVTATMIGQQIGVVTKPTAAGLIAAGLLSVIVLPGHRARAAATRRPRRNERSRARCPAPPARS